MRVIRNPFSDDTNKELCRLLERNYNDIKAHLMWQNDVKKTVKTIPEWKDEIDRDSLMKVYSRKHSLDKGRTRNLNHVEGDVGGQRLSNDVVKIRKILEDKYGGEVVVSGQFYYPPTGFMGWHTNCDAPCERFYITWASEDKKSFFRYYDYEKDEIITDYDDKGLTVRQFNIPDRPPHLWHCVGSECDRLSIGFRVYCNVALDINTFIELEKMLAGIAGKEGISSNLRTDYVTKLINNAKHS